MLECRKAEIPGIRLVWYRNCCKCRCRNQLGIGIRRTSPEAECSGNGLRCRMPFYVQEGLLLFIPSLQDFICALIFYFRLIHYPFFFSSFCTYVAFFCELKFCSLLTMQLRTESVVLVRKLSQPSPLS
jgi:hypothetical protein